MIERKITKAEIEAAAKSLWGDDYGLGDMMNLKAALEAAERVRVQMIDREEEMGDEIERLTAENKRLRAERDQWKADCELRSQTAADRLEALKVCEAEIERLRWALQRIVAEAGSDDGQTAWYGGFARRALEQQ